MCSFYFTTDVDCDIESKNRKAQLRGPDYTNVHREKDYICVHNLLDISTKKRLQPVIADDVALLYNGELYNDNAICDTDIIIPKFKNKGVFFVKELDGEYAICLIEKNTIHVYTDIFATKPLFFHIGKHIEIGSYPSTFDNPTLVERIPAGCYLRIDRNTKTPSIQRYHVFDLEETIDSFEPVIEAFEKAVQKRFKTKRGTFFGLSSGYESGSIMQAVFNSKNITTEAFYVATGDERIDVMMERKKALADNNIKFNSCMFSCEAEISLMRHKLKQLSEDFVMHESEDGKNMTDVESSLGHYLLMTAARSEDKRVYITGHGADEILCNYSKRFNFGTFPWKHFYGAKQREYLLQQEFISGAVGIEARYPMLDRFFVQAFLSLTKELKTSAYKQVFDYYLRKHSTSFASEFKTGMGGRFIV